MWALRELADAAEDFADAAEEAVQLLIRIRTASGRAARASVTAVSILLAGVRDVASAFAPVVRVVANFFRRSSPKPCRQERRRNMRDAEREARKRERQDKASARSTATASRVPPPTPTPTPTPTPPHPHAGSRRRRRRGSAASSGYSTGSEV
ncbi:hypothetical protein ACQJBY_013980 [Aegilops geniculata]